MNPPPNCDDMMCVQCMYDRYWWIQCGHCHTWQTEETTRYRWSLMQVSYHTWCHSSTLPRSKFRYVVKVTARIFVFHQSTDRRRVVQQVCMSCVVSVILCVHRRPRCELSATLSPAPTSRHKLYSTTVHFSTSRHFCLTTRQKSTRLM